MKKQLAFYFSLILSSSFPCKASFFDDVDSAFARVDAIMNDSLFFDDERALKQKQASLKQQLSQVEKRLEQSRRLGKTSQVSTLFKMPETTVVASDKSGAKVYRVSMELPSSFEKEKIKVTISQKNKDAAQLTIVATAQDALSGDSGDKVQDGKNDASQVKKTAIHVEQSIAHSYYSSGQGGREMQVQKNNGNTEIRVTLDLPDFVNTKSISTKQLMSLEKNKAGDKALLRIDLPVTDQGAKQDTELEFAENIANK